MVHINARLGDVSRSFEYDDAVYEDLLAILRELFFLPADAALILKYRDDEDDLITIGSSTELHDATLIFSTTLAIEVTSPTPLPLYGDSAPPIMLPTRTQELLDHAEIVDRTGSPAAGANKNTQLARPSEFQLFANELHYHRLLIQTAIADFFQRLGSNNRTRTSTLPTASEIGRMIASKLAELHNYAAPILEAIRTRVVKTLEQFFRAMSNQRITYDQVETVAHESVDVALQDMASLDAATDAATAASSATSDPACQSTSTNSSDGLAEYSMGSNDPNITAPADTEDRMASFDLVSRSEIAYLSSAAATAAVTAATEAAAAASVHTETEPATSSSSDATDSLASNQPESREAQMDQMDVSTPKLPPSESEAPLPMPGSEPAATTPMTTDPAPEPTPVATTAGQLQDEDDFVLIAADDVIGAQDATNPHAIQFEGENVEAPLVSSLVMPRLSASDLLPLSSDEEAKLQTFPYREQVIQMRSMGYTTGLDRLFTLLTAHDGDISAVMDKLAE